MNLRQGGRRWQIKLAGLVVFALVLLTALGGCTLIQNWLNPNHSPVAVISANPISGEAPLEVSFDASESYDPDGDKITYKWDFGDGNTAEGKTAQHTFVTPKNYTIRLTVLDKRGASGTFNLSITVAVETKKDTIGTAGGTVTTNQGSSVDIPPGTFTEETQVSISELAEPPVQFKPGVKSLGNGVLVTLSESNVNPSALAPETTEASPKIVTVSVPLSPSALEPSPDKKLGLLLKFSSTSPNGKPVYIVTGMEKSESVGKVRIPVDFINSLSEENAGTANSTLAVMPAVAMIELTPFETVITYIPSQLYKVNSPSDFTLIGQVNKDGTLAPQSPDIIPIILIHGYKILRHDEIIATVTPAAVEHTFPEYAQKNWGDFIEYFNNTARKKLNSLLPKPYHFELYVYRWDTDEGLGIAGDNLATLIGTCFGDRRFILIGHSAGGIVARACVENNDKIREKASLVITLASPHLGVPGDALVELFLDKSGKQLANNPSGPNRWITALNEKTTENKDWQKYILYGGYIKSAQHGLLWSLANAREWPDDNDGIVPLYSALAQEHEYNVRERHDRYEDYDHLEMLHGKEGRLRLFNSVCHDLQELAGELALPVAIAGNDQLANVGTQITLDGSASYDSQGSPLTFYWRQVSGPPVTLFDQTAMNPTFTPTVSGIYTFQLVVNNRQMDSPPDDVDITVTNVNPPDLTVSSVNPSTSFANPGDNVSVTFTVQNNGGRISGEFQNRVFLSTTRYGGQGGQKILLGDFPMSLNGSSSKTQTVNVTLPQVSAGDWYIAVYTDCNETIDEINENNNIDSAEISIGGPVPPNESPSVTIVSPANNSTFGVGEMITFQGVATDPEDGPLTGDALLWYAAPVGGGAPSVTGTGESISVNWLSVGTYTIGLTATDSQGETATDTVRITIYGPIAPNDPPSVTIVSPANNSTFGAGEMIAFQGVATDPEDGPLTGDALLWYAAPVDGGAPSVIGTGESISVNWLSVGTYTIGLTATDSQGETTTDTITIAVGAKTQSILFIYDYNGPLAPSQSITSIDRRGASDLAAMLKSTFTVEERNLNPITLNELAPYDIVVFSFGWAAREITDSEASALAAFVQNGGGLLLAGETGAAAGSQKHINSVNKVGNYFGIWFYMAMLCDPTNYYYDPSDPDGGVDSPLITNIYPNDITKGVQEFRLGYSTSLWVTAPATAVAYTNSYAWLDINSVWDDDLDEYECYQDGNEATGSFPVLAISQYGSGKVVAIGDASVFGNNILDFYDNRVLASNIFEWLARK